MDIAFLSQPRILMMHGSVRKFTIQESVIDENLDGEVFLLNIASGVYYHLDAVGSRIWEMLKQETVDQAICSRLLEQYAAESAQLHADVSDFLDCMVEHGLLRQVDD